MRIYLIGFLAPSTVLLHKNDLLLIIHVQVNHDLLVSKEALRMELQTVLSLPRNSVTDPKSRELVGGYIYQKMGKSGLIVAMQDFKHKLPISKFVKDRGGQMVIISSLWLSKILIAWQNYKYRVYCKCTCRIKSIVAIFKFSVNELFISILL